MSSGGGSFDLRGNSRDLGLEVVVGGIDLILVLEQEGAEDTVVDGDSAVEGGDHEPEKEDGLEEEVEGEPVQQEVGEGLDDGDESVDGPVGQPNNMFDDRVRH